VIEMKRILIALLVVLMIIAYSPPSLAIGMKDGHLDKTEMLLTQLLSSRMVIEWK